MPWFMRTARARPERSWELEGREQFPERPGVRACWVKAPVCTEPTWDHVLLGTAQSWGGGRTPGTKRTGEQRACRKQQAVICEDASDVIDPILLGHG